MLQPNDSMKSYTIAKLTRSCNWNPQQIPIQLAKTDIYNKFVQDPTTLEPIFETITVPESTDPETGIITPSHLQTEDEYTIRYINSIDGSITTKSEYDNQIVTHTIKRAALLGCTYHCG